MHIENKLNKVISTQRNKNKDKYSYIIQILSLW